MSAVGDAIVIGLAIGLFLAVVKLAIFAAESLVRIINLERAVEDCIDTFRDLADMTDLDQYADMMVTNRVEECLAILGADE